MRWHKVENGILPEDDREVLVKISRNNYAIGSFDEAPEDYYDDEDTCIYYIWYIKDICGYFSPASYYWLDVEEWADIEEEYNDRTI